MNIQNKFFNFCIINTLIALIILWQNNVYGQTQSDISINKKKLNVLFIFVDDLRPELGCYEKNYIHSPNIDKLASEGVLFSNQFVTVPTCGPSRACLLTGKWPKSVTELSNDVLEIKQKEKGSPEPPESFIDNLRINGYYTVGIGKISHSADGYIYGYRAPKSKQRELPYSWNEMLFDAGKWITGWNAFFGYSNGSNRNDLNNMVKPYESADVDDNGYPDGLTANLAARKIHELKNKNSPFFLGVGFFKPHLPFNAPKKYWNLYNESEIQLTPSPKIPVNVNLASLQESSEFNNGYLSGEEKASLLNPVSDQYAKRLRHGYYAAISYIDAQIGKVLLALKETGQDKNTIVILWGDHGWHLGDERVWGKHTLSEWALKSPLIIKAPGIKAVKIDNIVSSIDIYPTLMDLCGVLKPGNMDGKSFINLMKNPKNTKWDNVAYSYYKRGISLRTANYRLTKYFRSELPNLELYNYKTDKNETKNIANTSPGIIKKMLPILEKGNTGLYDN